MAAVQCSSEKESIVPITPSLARAVGVDVETRQSPPVHTPNKRFFNCSVQRASKNPPKEYAAHKPPTVTLGISDDEVKRRTGFRTKGAMLGYIFLICNGDIAVIQERHSSLTWFEEWFLSLEWTWGRTLTRWVDVAAEANYGVKEEKCRHIHRTKLALARRAVASWPRFCTHDEDVRLRKLKWKAKYALMRMMYHDMTGIGAYRFGASDIQNLTYSEYYGGNVLKGGVFTQCGGWLGTHELWGGNVSDSDYNRNAGYLEEQAAFQQNDLCDGKLLRFTNVYDKGYRARAICWEHGQFTAQPIFGRSDERFTGRDTIYSASIASDRAGNERAVNVCKRSGVIQRGFKPGMDAQMFQDVWITWGFQANFMFDSVL